MHEAGLLGILLRGLFAKRKRKFSSFLFHFFIPLRPTTGGKRGKRERPAAERNARSLAIPRSAEGEKEKKCCILEFFSPPLFFSFLRNLALLCEDFFIRPSAAAPKSNGMRNEMALPENADGFSAHCPKPARPSRRAKEREKREEGKREACCLVPERKRKGSHTG